MHGRCDDSDNPGEVVDQVDHLLPVAGRGALDERDEVREEEEVAAEEAVAAVVRSGHLEQHRPPLGHDGRGADRQDSQTDVIVDPSQGPRRRPHQTQVEVTRVVAQEDGEHHIHAGFISVSPVQLETQEPGSVHTPFSP